VICNNKQLAGVVKACPQSIAALMQIDGIGKAKVEKYGQEILALLKGKNEESASGDKAICLSGKTANKKHCFCIPLFCWQNLLTLPLSTGSVCQNVFSERWCEAVLCFAQI